MFKDKALPGAFEFGFTCLSESEGPMSVETPKLGPSGHVDDFARRNLPPAGQWPQMLLDRPEFQYPDHLNAAVELTDRIVEQGKIGRTHV